MVQLLAADRERLERSEDVGEPEADELDVLRLNALEDLRGVGPLLFVDCCHLSWRSFHLRAAGSRPGVTSQRASVGRSRQAVTIRLSKESARAFALRSGPWLACRGFANFVPVRGRRRAYGPPGPAP